MSDEEAGGRVSTLRRVTRIAMAQDSETLCWYVVTSGGISGEGSTAGDALRDLADELDVHDAARRNEKVRAG